MTETPGIYTRHIRPYIQAKRNEGRLNWVFNILDGKTEQEDVIVRQWSTSTVTSTNSDPSIGVAEKDEGFLMLPDLNWDRKTISSLHLLGLVERRDIWSVRDLKKKHVQWLKHMRHHLIVATTERFNVEEDQLKLYVHYQPTYYHFHIHVVHVGLEPAATQATGKAFGLESVISWLESMGGGGGEGEEERGMEDVELRYTVGEAQELWTEVFGPLKEGRVPSVVGRGGKDG